MAKRKSILKALDDLRFTSIIPDELTYTQPKPPTKRRKDSEDLKQRTEENERLLCSVPGCTHHRYGISQYCRHHRQHQSRTGHHTLTAPNSFEYDWLMSEGEKFLEWLYAKHGHGDLERGKTTIEAWIKGAARKLVTPHKPFLVPVRKIDRKLDQQSQATVILAHFQHERYTGSDGSTYVRDRKGNELTDVIKYYLFLTLYILRRDLVSGPYTREGWVHNHVGRYVKRKAKMVEHRETYHRKAIEMPTWWIGPDGKAGGYTYEDEIIPVKDDYNPRGTVFKKVGQMVKIACIRENLLSEVKAYYQHLQITKQDGVPEFPKTKDQRMTTDQWNSLPEVGGATVKWLSKERTYSNEAI